MEYGYKCPSPNLVHHVIRTHRFEPWLRQINGLKTDTCCLLPSQASVLLAYGKDWLCQRQDNVTERDSSSLYRQANLPVEKPYKVAILSQLGIHPDMTVYVTRK